MMRKALHFLDLSKEIFKRGINKLSFHRTLSAGTQATFTFSKVNSGKSRGRKRNTNKQKTPSQPEVIHVLGESVCLEKKHVLQKKPSKKQHTTSY